MKCEQEVYHGGVRSCRRNSHEVCMTEGVRGSRHQQGHMEDQAEDGDVGADTWAATCLSRCPQQFRTRFWAIWLRFLL